MPLSTQQLRRIFKDDIDILIEKASFNNQLDDLAPEIQKISEHLEEVIQEKVQLLETDFHDYLLKDEYLRTVGEGFDDLDRLLSMSKTFADTVHGKTMDELLSHVKEHYVTTLIPLLNLMAKLENDYISFATQTIITKQDALNHIQILIYKLKIEERYTRNNLLVFNKKRKLNVLEENIQHLDLKRKMIQLSLHHDRLNLYYFNQDHPNELKGIKEKAGALKVQLREIQETDVSFKRMLKILEEYEKAIAEFNIAVKNHGNHTKEHHAEEQEKGQIKVQKKGQKKELIAPRRNDTDGQRPRL